MESNINIENKISIPIKPLDIIFFQNSHGHDYVEYFFENYRADMTVQKGFFENYLIFYLYHLFHYYLL